LGRLATLKSSDPNEIRTHDIFKVIEFDRVSGKLTLWPCFDKNSIMLDHSQGCTNPTEETYQSPTEFNSKFSLINRKQEKRLRDRFFTQDAVITIVYTIDQNNNVMPTKIRPERLDFKTMLDYNISNDGQQVTRIISQGYGPVKFNGHKSDD